MGHVRGCPVLRPVVVRSKTFILPMLAPSLPLLSRYSRRCSDPMTFIMVRMTDVLPCVVVSIGRLINTSPRHRSMWAVIARYRQAHSYGSMVHLHGQL